MQPEVGEWFRLCFNPGTRSMKTRYLIPLALALLGCSSPKPLLATLTADQAGTLAQQLANEKAQTLFNCQPFREGPPSRFVQGRWVWRDRRGHGFTDIEGTVEFEADEPNVNVILLDSRAMLLERLPR